MSNNEDGLKKNGHNAEIRQRIVDATLKEFKAKHAPRKMDEIVAKAKNLSDEIGRAARSILKAERDAGRPYNEIGMQHMIASLYLDGFSKFTRDELIHLCSLMHGEVAMEGIAEIVAQGLEGGENPDNL